MAGDHGSTGHMKDHVTEAAASVAIRQPCSKMTPLEGSK